MMAVAIILLLFVGLAVVPTEARWPRAARFETWSSMAIMVINIIMVQPGLKQTRHEAGLS